jgi:hypothetical protein
MIRIKGTRFSVDKRGLLTASATYLCDGLSEAVSGNLPNPFGSGQFIGRSGGEWDTGEEKWVVTGNFEGVVFEPGADSEDYSLDAEFSEEPIESHPAISTIMQRYQGTKDEEGRVQFAETITGSGSGGSGLSNTRQRSEKNPFFGVQSYPAMRMVAAHTYVGGQCPTVFIGGWARCSIAYLLALMSQADASGLSCRRWHGGAAMRGRSLSATRMWAMILMWKS